MPMPLSPYFLRLGQPGLKGKSEDGMRRLAIAAAVTGLVLLPSVAAACQCILPKDSDARREVIFARNAYVFSGRVISVRKLPPRSPDLPEPTIEARVKVIRQVKGALPDEVVVMSYGGDNGENCGAGVGLAAAWANERPYNFAISRSVPQSDPPKLWTDGCNSNRFFLPPEPAQPANE